ncbi:hypothetical protein P8452_44084 [Trifolium repens]|nr:hypothetical protein P8452_44084 [Trifolium repens]
MVYNEKLAVCDIHEVVVEETSMAAFAHRDYFSSANSREAKNNLGIGLLILERAVLSDAHVAKLINLLAVVAYVIAYRDPLGVNSRRKTFAFMDFRVSSGRSICLLRKCRLSFQSLHWVSTLLEMECKKRIGSLWFLYTAMLAKENKASKVMHEEDIRSDESIPDTDDYEQQDFDEIKDPRQQADAVNKVLEEVIQLPALLTFWLYIRVCVFSPKPKPQNQKLARVQNRAQIFSSLSVIGMGF